MYRPKGLKNPYRGFEHKNILTGGEIDLMKILSTARHNAFEVGAGAMLEGLKEEGAHIKDGGDYRCPCEVCSTGEDCVAIEDGVIVFIPDEIEVKEVR